MSIKSRVHISVLTTEFEFISIFACVALLSDFVWVLHDISTNGFSITYAIVSTGLFISLLGTIYICYTHHKKFFKLQLKSKLQEELKIHKRKAKQGSK